MFKIKNIYGEPTKKKLLKSNPLLKVSILNFQKILNKLIISQTPIGLKKFKTNSRSLEKKKL